MTAFAAAPIVAGTVAGGRVTVPSNLFGSIQVTDDQVVRFEDGIAGFADCTRWILIEGERSGTSWLQSVDVEGLAFLVIDPFLFFDGYSVDLSPHDVRRLRATEAMQLAVFAIVTFPATRTDAPSANLQGPIVINTGQRCAAQVVLGDGPWGVRQPFQLLPLVARS